MILGLLPHLAFYRNWLKVEPLTRPFSILVQVTDFHAVLSGILFILLMLYFVAWYRVREDMPLMVDIKEDVVIPGMTSASLGRSRSILIFRKPTILSVFSKSTELESTMPMPEQSSLATIRTNFSQTSSMFQNRSVTSLALPMTNAPPPDEVKPDKSTLVQVVSPNSTNSSMTLGETSESS